MLRCISLQKILVFLSPLAGFWPQPALHLVGPLTRQASDCEPTNHIGGRATSRRSLPTALAAFLEHVIAVQNQIGEWEYRP
jgi:hypothetical protein